MNGVKRGAIAVAGVAGFAMAGAVSADVNEYAFIINVEAEGMSGSWSVPFDEVEGDGNGNYTWNLPSPVSIMDSSGQVVLATLDEASIGVIADPVVSLNFQVSAGAVASVFSIDSPIVGFAAMSNMIGTASAGVTVTDNLGDGAILGLSTTPGLYRSEYNGSTLFADLLNGAVVAGANQTEAASDSLGPIAIGGSVSDISSQFRFSLTPFDSASGTSVFEVVPAPGSLALLGMAGLIAGRRRRG